VIKIAALLTDSIVRQLRSGDSVSISGAIYVARDAAHKRMARDSGER
jgi:fumarate hydratase subunit beta